MRLLIIVLPAGMLALATAGPKAAAPVAVLVLAALIATLASKDDAPSGG